MNEKIIFHKIHICDLCGLHELYEYASLNIGRKNNYFLTWISAQVKEMGGFVFRNCEIHFSRVFWVRNK